MLTDARESECQDVRLCFHDWDWFRDTYGSESVEDYYFNGYGVEGLVKAARVAAGVEAEEDGSITIPRVTPASHISRTWKKR